MYNAKLIDWDFSIHSRKMEQILLAFGPSKETITAVIMLYKDIKAMVHSLNNNADFFDIVTGVLQEDTLALFLLIVCLDYVLWKI